MLLNEFEKVILTKVENMLNRIGEWSDESLENRLFNSKVCWPVFMITISSIRRMIENVRNFVLVE